MAEIHIVGEISHAKEFPKQELFCRWKLQCGNNWKVISGKQEGQTQVISSEFDDKCKWSYPLDIHLTTTGIPGWPKIYVQVYHLDWLNRSHLYGYGFVCIPTSPGSHVLNCYTWRPLGSIRERFLQYFLGGGPQLKYPDLILSSNDRYKLNTEAMGVVSFEMGKFGFIGFLLLGIVYKVLSETTSTAITESTTEMVTPEVTNDYENDNETLEIGVSTVDDSNSTCDENCTTLTTIKTGLSPTKAPTTIKPNVNVPKSSLSSTKTCSCNIQERICDINCCCDKDCSYDMRQVFGKCNDDINRIYDTSFCEYTKFIYKNNTPFEWSVNQNGLFCVVKTNLPRQYYMHKEITLNTAKEASLVKQNKFSWSEIYLSTIPSIDTQQSFLYGRPAYLVKNNQIIQWVIPDTLHTDSCSSTKTINLLEDIETKCTQYEINNDNKQLNVYNYIENVTVLSLSSDSKYFNQKRLTLLQHCPKEICKNFEISLCNEFLQNCSKINQNVSLAHTCQGYSFNLSCRNLLHKLQYNIYHNGTQGIKKIEVLVHLMNISFSQQFALTQHFKVNYFWVNQNVNITFQRSGNPGYILTKPIITANLVQHKFILSKKPLNVSTNTTIERNHSKINEIFLTFPKNVNGKCILTNIINNQIQFGVNHLINCELRELINIKNKKSKDLCQNVQKLISNFWSLELNNSTNKLFGKYGNANVTNIKEWGNVSYTLTPENMLKRVNSVPSGNKSHLNCINLCTKLKIDVFHARSIVEDLHDQEQIVWITYSFGNCRNYTFQIEDDHVSINIRLRFEIMFYDVTTEKLRKYVEPPSLKIRLPYDFFYPFVKIDNGCNLIKKPIVLMISLVLIVINLM